MTMFQLVVVALIASAASGREFQNPVLDGGSGYYSAGVIKCDDQYYTVASTRKSESNKFPMYQSSDLQNWHAVGYALPEGYIPDWTSKNYWSPEIHQIGENDFRLFFDTYDRETGRYGIAVGVSKTVLGPYAVQNRPLQIDSSQDSYEPSLVQDGARKYLVWQSAGASAIFGRELTPDCLGFIAGSSPKLLLSSNLEWEGGRIGGPWYAHRPDGWYMFYSGNDVCTTHYAVGVARSENPLGPFEKRGEPIIVTNTDFKGPGQPSVVSDIYIGTSVMVYHSFKSGHDMCSTGGAALLSQTVEWGDDGWPIMVPY